MRFYQQTGSNESGFFGCLAGIYCERDRESCSLRKKFFLFTALHQKKVFPVSSYQRGFTWVDLGACYFIW